MQVRSEGLPPFRKFASPPHCLNLFSSCRLPQYAAPFRLGWRDAVAFIALVGLVFCVQQGVLLR